MRWLVGKSPFFADFPHDAEMKILQKNGSRWMRGLFPLFGPFGKNRSEG
jgi:hypothetical protein